MYIADAGLLELIPLEEKYDMPDLISAALARGKSVGVFPISEKSWLDLGQLDEYLKTVERLQHFKKF
jgi:NDP-sugar pyrophosphorylase family protein